METKVIFAVIGLILIIVSLVVYLFKSQSTVSVDASDAGETVTLSKGDYLNVSLAGNLTTGYTWEMLPLDTSIITQRGEPIMKPDSKAIGSGGMITLKFQAVKTGQTQLKLIYHRPWEKGVEPVNTFEITIVVK